MRYPPIVYSPDYHPHFGPHVFPVAKYRALRHELREWPESVFHPPEALDPARLELVHDPGYLRDLLELVPSPRVLRSELPMSASVRDFSLLMSTGTVTACRLALEHGLALHLGGGFHHAFADHAEGFCLINDVALALRVLQAEGRLERAAVVDLDVHQGNGTAAIFAGDERVFTMSMHQENNYPVKQPSDLDVGLPDGVGNREYLEELEVVLTPTLTRNRPQLAVYLAGADPYRDDQLGGLGLSMEGLEQRDRRVLTACRELGVPCALLLAGGYSRRFADTVNIHRRTFETALDLYQDWPPPARPSL